MKDKTSEIPSLMYLDIHTPIPVLYVGLVKLVISKVNRVSGRGGHSTHKKGELPWTELSSARKILPTVPGCDSVEQTQREIAVKSAFFFFLQ